MTKDAVKKYTKQLGVGGMILHYISRFLTKAEMQIIGKMTRRFGKVKKNRMVLIKNMRSSGWFHRKRNSEIKR